MAEMDFKRVNVIDTSGRSDTSIGVAIVDEKGRHGFINDKDERPYLPAGGERVLRDKAVTDSLTFKEHDWGGHIKTEETLTSKLSRANDEEKKLRQIEKEIRSNPASTDDEKIAAKEDRKNAESKAMRMEAGKEPSKDSTPEIKLNLKDEVTIENSIEPVKAREKQTPDKESFVTRSEGIEKDQLFDPAAGNAKSLIPEDIQKKYIQDGSKFYFAGALDKLAFRDTGRSLKTKLDGEAVVDSMIAIAKNRGWSEIKVTGTESFKKDVWQEATKQGIAVRGYTPTKTEVAAMEKQGFDIPKQGQSHAPEAEIKTNKEKAAEALKNLSASEAVKRHPELAPYVAAVSAIEKKLATESLSETNKKAIMDRVKQNAVNSYNEGITPKVQLKEKQQRREVSAQAELSR